MMATGQSPDKKTNSNAQNAALNLEQINITEDYLVTYREFMSALRSGLKNSLYKTLLPRTLSFADVLDSKPEEKVYEVSDCNLDDFYMFRYELNSVFQQHLFKPDRARDLYLLGQNPLSKCQGLPVKEMVDHLRKNSDNFKNRAEYESLMMQCQEIYQPPGIIKPVETVFNQPSKIEKDIRMTIPTDQLYKRTSADKKKAEAEAKDASASNRKTDFQASTNLSTLPSTDVVKKVTSIGTQKAQKEL